MLRTIVILFLLTIGTAGPAGADEPLRCAALLAREAAFPAPCEPEASARAVLAEELKASGEALLARYDGGVFHVLYRGTATSVFFCCDLQGPLGFDDASGLWAASWAGGDFSRLALELGVFVDNERGSYGRWLGSDAVPFEPMAQASYETHVITGRADPARKRTVLVYRPDADPSGPVDIVYMADGYALKGHASYVDPSAPARPVVFVGLVSGSFERAAVVLYDRNQEYTFDPRKENPGFLAHNAFFLQEILPQVETGLLAGIEIRNRYTMGQSSGAAWAVTTVLQNPDLFAGAYASAPYFGPLRRLLRKEAWPTGKELRLAYGTIDRRAHRISQELACIVAEQGRPVALHAIPGGHSPTTWAKAFLQLVQPERAAPYLTQVEPNCR